ncbi:MAG: hypothetical protein ACRDRG_16425 [Pseudonocardiaceae bacterium]
MAGTSFDEVADIQLGQLSTTTHDDELIGCSFVGASAENSF